ncbi:hypothetical protein [Parasutterella muris]|uniref:Uncharacterized protein n=1 Tax=Parasutterella muris TaxID=2565572 RepID=A0A6L6YJ57_9BURK|nr:hypothetical protein [Parasutterella muris]MVX56779.1 hypothetical protein [Parasutterella muris]
MEEKKYNREDMLYRLSNWRRVYGDRRRQGVSITEICCRYARANIKRRRETPEEREAREREELQYRDPVLPPPDFRDANVLQSVWMWLPEKINEVPVKSIVKLLAFGTWKEYRNHLRSLGAKRMDRFIDFSLRVFFERICRYEQKINSPVANDDSFKVE